MTHAQRMIVVLVLGLAGLGVTLGIVFLTLPAGFRATPVFGLDLAFCVIAQVALMAYRVSMLSMAARSDTMPLRLSTTLYFRGYVVATALVLALGPATPWRTVHGTVHALLLLVLLGNLGRALLGGDFLKRSEAQDRAREHGYQKMVVAAQAAMRALEASPASAELRAPLAKLTDAITYADRGGVAASTALEARVVDQLRELAAALGDAPADRRDVLLAKIRSTQQLVDERRDLLKVTK